MLPLSQTHLSQFSACPRKYQHIFFDTLSGPSTHEQHTTTQWGSQFHLLMQQAALDLPVGVLSAASSEMAASLNALKKAAPEVFNYLPVSGPSDDTVESADTFSQSEHRRTLTFNGYLLTVVYDLVAIASNPQKSQRKGQIFDWKTHQQPPKKIWLEKDWQTRLYPYVLCETSDLMPDDIAMTYWFVRLKAQNPSQPEQSQPAQQSQPNAYTFHYSSAQHEQTRQDLQRLTDDLTKMRSHAFFPKVAAEKGLCDQCPFNIRCDRQPPPRSKGENQTTIRDPIELLKAARQLTVDTVEEIPL